MAESVKDNKNTCSSMELQLLSINTKAQQDQTRQEDERMIACIQDEGHPQHGHKGATFTSASWRLPAVSVAYQILLILSVLAKHGAHAQILARGPSPCPDGNGEGYSDLATLQADLDIAFSDSGGKQGGIYRLCPNTEFSFGVNSPGAPVSTTRSGSGLSSQVNGVHYSNERSPQVVTSFGYEPWEADISNSNDLERLLVQNSREPSLITHESDDIPHARKLQDFLTPNNLDVPSISFEDLASGWDDGDDDDDVKNEIFMLQSASASSLLSILGAEDWDAEEDIDMLMGFADDYYFNSNGYYFQGQSSIMRSEGVAPSARQSNTNVLPPIVILSSNTIIQCGDEGVAENQCIFSGGANQIVIGRDAGSVLLSGISFQEAIDVNVVSSGSQQSAVTLTKCAWRVSAALLLFSPPKTTLLSLTNFAFSRQIIV
jgi:hypothetical protein